MKVGSGKSTCTARQPYKTDSSFVDSFTVNVLSTSHFSALFDEFSAVSQRVISSVWSANRGERKSRSIVVINERADSHRDELRLRVEYPQLTLPPILCYEKLSLFSARYRARSVLQPRNIHCKVPTYAYALLSYTIFLNSASKLPLKLVKLERTANLAPRRSKTFKRAINFGAFAIKRDRF